MEEKGPWARSLARGDFVTCVELVPPRGIDLGRASESAASLRARGIDAVNVPDSPRAQAKMSAVAAAAVIQERTGIVAMPHITCKDKNLLALQAELLGAHALGIRNVLLVTGDSPSMGSYPDATAVFDMDSIGLCAMVSMLNRGYDLGRNQLGGSTEFCYGVALNPSALSLERELERFRRKIDAGAEFAITQPIFEASAYFRFLDGLGGAPPIPVVAGIWPLTSLRNAEFMKHEVPGVLVPDSVVERMAGRETREAAVQEGIAIARETLEELAQAIAGVQISATPATAYAVLEGMIGRHMHPGTMNPA
jgi:homocysteine S-methyltransferase